MCVVGHTRSVHSFTLYFAANDVSKGSYGIVKVRTTFAGAYTILTSSAFLHAGLMNSRREGRYTNLRLRTAPEDLTILSSILGISQEVCPFLMPPYGSVTETLRRR